MAVAVIFRWLLADPGDIAVAAYPFIIIFSAGFIFFSHAAFERLFSLLIDVEEQTHRVDTGIFGNPIHLATTVAYTAVLITTVIPSGATTILPTETDTNAKSASNVNNIDGGPSSNSHITKMVLA
jgi:hypothetical protein